MTMKTNTEPLSEPDLLSPTNAVATREPLPPPAPVAPTPTMILQAALERGITSENVAVVKELTELVWKKEARDAEKEFNRAFVELQKELPRIQATKIIPDKQGNQRSSFAPLEEIDAQARPLCLKHGFTYAFAEGEAPAGRITKICTLRHDGGHSVSNKYTVRIGSGPPGCSESQADGSAHSYAKRGALCDALGIVVAGIDNDARNEGAPITPKQAEELAHRVNATNTDKAAFLNYAGADSFAEIPAAKYDILDGFLKKKESRGK